MLGRRRVRTAPPLIGLGLGLALVTALVVVPSTPAAASPLGAFSCMPPSGLAQDASPGSDSRARRLYDGYLTLPGYREVYIGKGAINWGMNPFNSDTWTKYFLSLKWLESFTKWYQRHPTNTEYQSWLTRARAIAVDFNSKNPPDGGPNPASAWSAMYVGQRATVYSCLYDLSSSATKPTMGSILSTRYGPWLANSKHAPTGWNQGLDPAIGLLAAGCVTGNSSWADTASSRLGSLSTGTIDAQGAVNEQSNGYGNYLWQRFGDAQAKLQECGRPVPSTIASRRQLLSDFLAWSTSPTGKMIQIGDTYPAAPLGDSGSAADYAATQGASGTAPTSLVKNYSAGYVFGRSSWSNFSNSAFYSFRYGPGRQFHGHDDKGQITLSAYGDDVLTEGGHVGYAENAFRDWIRSPFAHNVMTAPGLAFDRYATDPITRQGAGSDWQWFETKDTGWYSASTRVHEPRTRGALLSMEASLPFAVVWDRMHRSSPGSLQQLWHLPIGTSVSVSGRSKAVGTLPSGTRVTLFQIPVDAPLPAGALQVQSGATNPIQGWVATGDNKKYAAPTLVMSRATRSASVLTVVVPSPAGTTPTISATKGSDGAFTITISLNGVTRVVRASSGGSMSRL